MTKNPEITYTKKDFMSDQLVRWCPGCGDYSILSQVQTVFSKLGIPREQFAIIAGIGCSSRFPYYMNTFGFHTIHGRAPAFASGLKTTRPDLSVWVITGDGDSLSIGGNHLIHVLRRNVDINILMFNNRIYGLTKGQYSPTSEKGKKTKSTPLGSIDQPFKPLSLALGAGASFIARSVDVFAKHLREVLVKTHEHAGTSFLEIYQNCNIFNDNAFADFTERNVRDDRVLYLEHGEPLVWGKTSLKGFILNGLSLEIIDVPDEATAQTCLKHDTSNLALAHLLADLKPTEGDPVPVGVFYQEDRPTYESAFQAQISEAEQVYGPADLEKLVHSGQIWNVG